MNNTKQNNYRLRLTSRLKNILFLGAVLLFILSISSLLNAEDETPVKPQPVRTPDELLKDVDGTPPDEVILELFINCSEWDSAHLSVKDTSEKTLANFGAEILPPIIEKYMPSNDLRRRMTLDKLINGIGYEAADYLIPYLKHEDPVARRHAVYLLAASPYIRTLEDPKLLGPLEEDVKIEEALLQTLKTEENKDVIRSLLSALAQIRDTALVPTIASYMDDPYEPTRMSVMNALGSIPHISAAEKLFKSLENDIVTVRQVAILRLAAPTVGTIVFPQLLQNLTDPDTDSLALAITLEILNRHLAYLEADDSETTDEQCAKVCNSIIPLLKANHFDDDWRSKAYAVALLQHCENKEETINFLRTLKKEETHPFVESKIDQVLRALE